MKTPVTLTPKRSPHLNDNARKMSDEFLDSGVRPMSMPFANMNPNSCDSANLETSNFRCLFTSAKYFQVFGSEAKNEIKWNGMMSINEGNSQQSSEVSLCASSEGSSVPISRNRSMSLSPSNEISPTADADGQRTNLLTHSSNKEIHVKLETGKHCGMWNNLDDYSQRTQSKNRGNFLRKNRWQRSWKDSSLKTSNNERKSYGAKDMRCSVTMCRQTTQNKEATLGKAITSTKKGSQKRISNKEITFEMFSGWLEREMLTHKGILFSFVTDQEGSRFLQEHLILATADQLWSMFAHLKPDFIEISHDVFGNYVAQKYLELGNDQLLNVIVETLKPSILSLSLGIYGCRVVQKLLECAAQERKKVVVQQLAGSILKCIYDHNGTHVVQKMIQCLKPRELSFVVDEIAGHTYRLSMHPYGSRVLQRLLEKVSWRMARPLLNDIKEHILTLSKNKYGNYIIQWIIKHYSMERREIVLKLIGHVAELSKDKYASNVIEMIFRRSSQAHLGELAEELLYDPAKNGTFPTLALLLNDQSGNYALESLLNSSYGAFRQRFIRSLSSCGRSNKNCGKYLLVKAERMLRKKRNDIWE